MKTIRMEDMNWPDIKKAIDEGFTTVVVAVGSTEQHGPYLPTKTDTLIGDEMARRVAFKVRKGFTGQDNLCGLFRTPSGLSRDDFDQGWDAKDDHR